MIDHEKSKLLYLNSGFDLELSETRSHHLHGAIAQMTQWFLPVGDPRDFVLLDMRAPDELLAYLDGAGLALPHVLEDEAPSGLLGEAWGWTESSVSRLGELGVELRHPPLDVVKEVNSRDFCFKLGIENKLGVTGAFLEQDPLRLIDRKLCPPGPTVLKAMHSNAGRGMMVRRGESWTARQIQSIEKLAGDGQTVVVEPWLARRGDISTRFDLGTDGAIENIFHYRTLIGPDGHCAGDLLEPDDDCMQPWTKSLDRAAMIAGRSLFEAGYFGPVGLDHVLYQDGDGLSLAAAVDLNARHTLGTLAQAIWKKLHRDKPLLLRLVSGKKHRLPADYTDFGKLLGDLSWNRAKGEGVILLTALRVESGGALVQPRRSLFCVQAKDRDSLKGIYSELLKRLGRKLDDRLPFEALRT